MELNLWTKLESYLVCVVPWSVSLEAVRARVRMNPRPQDFEEGYFARIVPLPLTGKPDTCWIVAYVGVSRFRKKAFCVFVVVPMMGTPTVAVVFPAVIVAVPLV